MALKASVLECPSLWSGYYYGFARLQLLSRSNRCIRRTQDIGGKNPAEVNKYVELYKNFLKESSGESVETLDALGICLLKRGTYGEATKYFERAINLMPDDGEPYYYMALALMQKKRPYLHTLREIKQIVEHLESALSYSPVGKYYYLLYLIQKDFYDKKRLRNGKNAEDLRADAVINEVDDEDIAKCKEYCNLTDV